MDPRRRPAEDPVQGDNDAPSSLAIEKAVSAIAIAMGLSVDRPTHSQVDTGPESEDPLTSLFEASERSGISLRETEFRSANETFALVQQGYPVVFVLADGMLLVLEVPEGRKLEASIISDQLSHRSISVRQLNRMLGDQEGIRMMVAQRELECDTLSSASPEHESDGHHEHTDPFKRFIALLELDRRDIALVVLFASVAGVLALATPLVIESLVNVVSWGIYFQPLFVLAGMLLTCLGIAGILKLLQTWVVEIIQRRQFVRIVSDLAHRFPRANQNSLEGEYPRELANRVFDIMTIQKATSVLLLDGISIILTTLIGLLLLAFYHPLLLGFDIVLVITMITFTWVLGRGGIRTAIGESKTKYAVAHWLQDVISMPSVFKTGGGESLAIRRANQLTADYIAARKRQFGVVIRQVIFAVSLQVIASTALLGLGGWLVIDRQLTLGQLVASELVVTVVVGAFAKAGKSLEKFYDMMAGIDKVGHLLDIPPDPRMEIGDSLDGPGEVKWNNLSFKTPTNTSKIAAATIQAGSCVAIVGDDQVGKSQFAQAISGLRTPQEGTIQVAGTDAFETAIGDAGEQIGYAGPPEIFHGSIRENVGLGRNGINQSRVREVLSNVRLGELILSLPDGLNTHLQTGGFPFSYQQQSQLVIARAIAAHPKVLVINGLLDSLDGETRDAILKNLTVQDAGWTLLIVTNRDDIAELCESTIAIHG